MTSPSVGAAMQVVISDHFGHLKETDMDFYKLSRGNAMNERTAWSQKQLPPESIVLMPRLASRAKEETSEFLQL